MGSLSVCSKFRKICKISLFLMSQLYKKVGLSIFDNQSDALQLLGIMGSSKSKNLRKISQNKVYRDRLKSSFYNSVRGVWDFFLQFRFILSSPNKIQSPDSLSQNQQ